LNEKNGPNTTQIRKRKIMPTFQTTILSILTKDTSTGDHDCIVSPTVPLWIKELILCPIANLGAPSGRLPPGTPPNGSLRTLCLDSTHEVFTTTAPFNFSVTYDTSNNYKVSEAHVVHSGQAAIARFGLGSESNAAFVNPEARG